MAQDELKEQALKLSNKKSTLNSALVEAQGAVINRAGELSEAQNSVRDLKLKLEDLEKMLSESRAREETLTKSLVEEKQLRRTRPPPTKIMWRARTDGSAVWRRSPAGSPRSWPPWGCQTRGTPLSIAGPSTPS